MRHLLVLLAVACGPAAPSIDPAVARERAAICDTVNEVRRPGDVPPQRFRRALERADQLATSADSKALLQRLREGDLAEQAAELRRAADTAGLAACPLADELHTVATATVDRADAQGMFKVVEALQTVAPEHVDRILAVGCSEIPTCGRECSSGLAALFDTTDPAQTVRSLAAGCAEFRPLAAAADLAAMYAWIRTRVSAAADASAPLLSADDAARFAEMRKNLKL